MKTAKMNGFVFMPETLDELIKLEDMARNWYHSSVGEWFLKYWDFVHENEHGNELTVKELFESGVVSETYDFAFTKKPLSEWDIWGYLSNDTSDCALTLMKEFTEIKRRFQQ
jgi:hypothetical protein